MTLRAVILGLLGAVAIAAFGYVNDELMSLNPLVGNHFPISVFGGIIVLMVAVNPALSRLRPRWSFRPAEMAVMLTFVLSACSIPGSGFMRTFTPALVMPIHMNRTEAGWRKNEVMSYVSPILLPNGGADSEEVVGTFLTGKGKPGRPIGISEVPWKAWSGPLLAWMPLTLLSLLAAIGLALVVHRQWATRERLRYPIAYVTSSLVQPGRQGGLGPIFRQRLFWIGLLGVLAVRAVNGVQAWYPNSLEIPTKFNFTPAVTQTWPVLHRWPNMWAVLFCQIFPTVIGFSYFLASDVALSLGISKVAWVAVAGLLMSHGVDAGGGNYFVGSPGGSMTFGSYLGLAAMLAYTGREYYWRIAKSAFAFRRDAGLEASSIWGARVFALCAAGMVAMLVCFGLDWPLAVLTVVLMFLLFLVMSRISAETGLFYIQTSWNPYSVILALFGAAALGPQALMVLGLVCIILEIDPRECLMPYVTNALKMCEDNKVGTGRAGWGAAAAVTLALAAAVPTVLWVNYNYGLSLVDTWATKSVPAFVFDHTSQNITSLNNAGTQELANSLRVSGLERFAHMKPSPSFLGWAGAGLVLVFLCSFARLRFPWWPIHPVLFLVWFPNPLNHFAWSFFIGWLVRWSVVKFGGTRAYEKAKPLMIGLIAGDVLGGLLFMAVGLVHYLMYGTRGPEYYILPT